MSQHVFNNEKGVEVLMGFDRPLGFVFCVVFRDSEMEYSNLADPEAGTRCQDVGYFRKVLADLHVSVPEAMFAEVAEDQRNRAGNRIVRHSGDTFTVLQEGD